MLGKPPSPDQMQQYLGAYFGEALPAEAVEAVARSSGGGLDDVRSRLERVYQQVRGSCSSASGKSDAGACPVQQLPLGLFQQQPQHALQRAALGRAGEGSAGEDSECAPPSTAVTPPHFCQWFAGYMHARWCQKCRAILCVAQHPAVPAE